MADFPDIEANDYNFTLLANSQSYESPLTRHTQTGALAGDQWQSVVTFNNRTGLEARSLRSFVLGLGGQNGRFNFFPPDLNQLGTGLGVPVVDGAGQLGSTLSVKGWDYPQELAAATGDYITVNSELKLLTKDTDLSALVSYPNVTNYMPSPFNPEGWSSDSSGTITNAAIKNPSGESFVGFVDITGSGSFIMIESPVVSMQSGEKWFSAIVFKDITNDYEFSFQSVNVSGEVSNNEIVLNPDLTVKINDPDLEIRVMPLNDGFSLVEMKYVAPVNINSNYQRIYIRNPVIGSQCYVQAAFFGKSPLEYPYAQYNEFEDAAELGEWSTINCTTSIGSGLLNGVATGSDPAIRQFLSANFDGNKYSTVEVKWRVNSGFDDGQFWWRDSSGSFDSNKQVAFGDGSQPYETTTGPDGSGFFTTILDMSQVAEWIGTDEVSYLRFDFSNSATGDFDIDYIKIYSPSLLTAYEEWWPALVEGTTTLEFTPPLRKAPPDLAPIEFEKPYMPARLENDEQASFQVSGPVIYNASFSVVEVF